MPCRGTVICKNCKIRGKKVYTDESVIGRNSGGALLFLTTNLTITIAITMTIAIAKDLGGTAGGGEQGGE